ncbi:MAG: class I SAM-dependent methyltransferase [Owenweeksia sp.]|nr:class I SAM-dependent methyltransferase [Owenweeksia sp.]
MLSRESGSFGSGIVVTSAHLAKGLEFDQVVVPHVTATNYKTHLDTRMLSRSLYPRYAQACFEPHRQSFKIYFRIINCPLCSSTVLNKVDDEFFSCGTCHGLAKHPDLYPCKEAEESRYLEHNNEVNDPRYQRFTSPIHNFVKEHYSPTDVGLDFGSGTGPVITKVLRDDGFDIEAYDPFFAPNKELFDRTYDYIAAYEVFEHFFNPKAEIAGLVKMVRTGGRLLVMTFRYDDSIDFKNWVYRKDISHVFIYRKETFQYIVATYNLQLESVDKRLIVLRKTGSG